MMIREGSTDLASSMSMPSPSELFLLNTLVLNKKVSFGAIVQTQACI